MADTTEISCMKLNFTCKKLKILIGVLSGLLLIVVIVCASGGGDKIANEVRMNRTFALVKSENPTVNWNSISDVNNFIDTTVFNTDREYPYNLLSLLHNKEDSYYTIDTLTEFHDMLAHEQKDRKEIIDNNETVADKLISVSNNYKEYDRGDEIASKVTVKLADYKNHIVKEKFPKEQRDKIASLDDILTKTLARLSGGEELDKSKITPDMIDLKEKAMDIISLNKEIKLTDHNKHVTEINYKIASQSEVSNDATEAAADL